MALRLRNQSQRAVQIHLSIFLLPKKSVLYKSTLYLLSYRLTVCNAVSDVGLFADRSKGNGSERCTASIILAGQATRSVDR